MQTVRVVAVADRPGACTGFWMAGADARCHDYPGHDRARPAVEKEDEAVARARGHARHRVQQLAAVLEAASQELQLKADELVRHKASSEDSERRC